MADPTTSNVLLAVPTRGSDPGTWDVPVNANSSAADGYFGGVATITLSNANVALTAPAGIPTPGGGPFQSQNRILKFTGALTSSVTITLPLPGEYTIQNLTTGNFNVVFAALGVGNVISTPQGSVMHIWNDGTNVYLVKNVIPGELKFLGGVSAIPSWISACTIPPYLLCDGTVYNFSVYPALGALYVGSFGGNGITTFGVEDLRGRVPLAYDGTGTRITTAGSGINGQTLGAAGGGQNIALAQSDLPNVAPTITITDPGHTHPAKDFGGGSGVYPLPAANAVAANPVTYNLQSAKTGITAAASSINGNVTQTLPIVVQPSQVSGIWLVAT